MRLVIATTNRGKLREVASILAGIPLTLSELTEYGPIEPPEETGQTFAENARSKARYYARRTGQLTVAEDSGLEVDALGGEPGVASARLGGTDLPFPGKFDLIYAALRARRVSGSRARFVCALALARGETVLFEAQGTIEGEIAPEPRGTDGFGYDPIFFYPPLGCTLAEAGDAKLGVSHRTVAFRALRTFLTEFNQV
jgi:XTP/dITP diphosphohydrolase